MDFIVMFPQNRNQYDSIWVVVHRLNKSVHFIPVKSTYTVEDYASIYIGNMVSLYGVPLSIILDRSTQFTSKFLR